MHASMAYVNGVGSLRCGARRAARDELKLLNTLLVSRAGPPALGKVKSKERRHLRKGKRR